MLSDKENQGTPKPSEVKKRPSVHSPFTAGTPSTRPNPRKMARPLGSWGDPNLEETLTADETFNMSDVKEGLNESIAQEHRLAAGASPGKHEADPNIEETFVERRSMICDETMVHAENVNDPRPSEEGTIGPLVLPDVLQLLPDQSRLKSCKKSPTKRRQLVRDGDVNLEESALELTMFDMDKTQSNITPKGTQKDVPQESLALVEDEGDTTLKNEEPQVAEAVDPNILKTACEADGQQQIPVHEEASLKADGQQQIPAHEEASLNLRGDSVFASVEAVVICEKGEDRSPVQDKATTLANELLDAGVEEEVAIGTEVAGSVNVSVLGVEAPKPSQRETLPCVSDRPSDFSFTSAVRSRNSTAADDDVKSPRNDSFTYAKEMNETELVFAAPAVMAGGIAYDNKEKWPLGCEGTVIADVSMDITASIDDTMMVLCEPVKAAAILENDDVFPAHYGTSEVEGRVSRSESVATAITYESVLQNESFDDESQKIALEKIEAKISELSDEGVVRVEREIINVIRTREVIEHIQTETIISDPSPSVAIAENAEELQAGDIESEANGLMMEEAVSTGSFAVPRYESPLSPVPVVSRDGAILQESGVPRCLDSDASLVYPQKRKYNLNDSEISFMINEVKVLHEEEMRRSKSPSAIEQLSENVAQLEAEKAELCESLRAASVELDQCKQKLAAGDSALSKANKKLVELEKAKELAEKTIADYEFIVMDLKKKHNKQKEDLQSRLIAQDDELEKYRAAVQSQSELTYTSAGLSAELALANERLLHSEAARAAAQKQCEELTEALERATRSETTLAFSREASTAEHDLAVMRKKLTDLEKEVLDKEEALLTSNRRHTEEYIKLQEKLNETALALETSEGSTRTLRKQLDGVNNEMALLREIQLASEMELMRTKDELDAVNRALEELQSKEEAHKEAILQHDVIVEELNNLRNQLKEKSDVIEKELTQVTNLKAKCAMVEEQLQAEKLARDVADREIVQLRDENNSATEALEKARTALTDAENRAAAAERNLKDHIKCHTEELNLRVTELENKVAAGLADKQMLTSQLEEKVEKQATLTCELEKASEAISKLEAEVTVAQKENQALMGEMKLGKQLYEEKAAEAEKVAAEFTELQSSVISLNLEKDRFKEELAVAVEKAEKSEAESQKVIESLKAEIATLIAERDSLRNRLAATEDQKVDLERNFNELKANASQSQAEIAALISASTKAEEEWKEKEQEYKQKISAAEEAATKMSQLEVTVEYLKSEAMSLSNEIKEVTSKLDVETESKQKATTALTALEEQYHFLQEAKKAVEKEYEEAKKLFDVELSAAQDVAEELKQQIKILEERLSVEESCANEKIEAAAEKLARLEVELRESKAAQASAEMQVMQHSEKSKELMDKYVLLEAKLAEAYNEGSQQKSEEIEAEMKELKRLLELKTREIDRLGGLCDEFDEIEADYRQKLFSVVRERDQLKAQLEPAKLHEVPNLRAALTEGIQMLSPETTIVANDDRLADTKSSELEKMVEKLRRENARLEQLRTVEDTKMTKEIEELRRRCRIQENRILELEKLCDDADESEGKLRKRIRELEKEISAQKVSATKMKVPVPRLLDALQHREIVEEEEPERIEAGKEQAYVSAPTSPRLLQRSLDEVEGPVFEESTVESAATPNRSLHTTLYKKLDKTVKLSDTPESKANTSRCTQQ